MSSVALFDSHDFWHFAVETPTIHFSFVDLSCNYIDSELMDNNVIYDDCLVTVACPSCSDRVPYSIEISGLNFLNLPWRLNGLFHLLRMGLSWIRYSLERCFYTLEFHWSSFLCDVYVRYCWSGGTFHVFSSIFHLLLPISIFKLLLIAEYHKYIYKNGFRVSRPIITVQCTECFWEFDFWQYIHRQQKNKPFG